MLKLKEIWWSWLTKHKSLRNEIVKMIDLQKLGYYSWASKRV